MGGMALSVLAAKRAANAGADVVVAVADTPEDRLLAQTLMAAGLNVVKGPLHNVLARFLLATEDLPNDAICVRLTCDNPCPDGTFIQDVVAQLISAKTRYIAYGNDGQWLPYGMSAEAFYVADLRVAAQLHHDDPYVCEHVTPSIRAAHAPRTRTALDGCNTDLGHLRCTVDTLEDYLRIVDVFDGVPDPVAMDWKELIQRLQGQTEATPAGLVLGTVQLGLAYGVNKDDGVMSGSQANDILQAALMRGCNGLDTARAYGVSEERIGAFFQKTGVPDIPVITKLAPLDPQIAGPSEVRASVKASLEALGQNKLDTVLLHRATHLQAGGGRIWQTLRDLQAEGVISTLGVSVQTPEELQNVLDREDVQHVQLPFNLLDWRWTTCIAGLRMRPDITVHVRSVFLQGLLSQEMPSSWPNIVGVDPNSILSALTSLVDRLDRKSLADLCIAYVRSLSWVDGVVIGVDTQDQLHEIADLFAQPPLTWAQVDQVQRRLPVVSENLLNPALWPEVVVGTVAPQAPPPMLKFSEPFVVWRDETVMASFPSLVATSHGPLLSFRIAPREPYNFKPGLGHQQHLHPRSSLALATLDEDLQAQDITLLPCDLFAADQDPNLARLPNGNLLMSSFTWRPQAFGDTPEQAPGFFCEKASNMSAQFWGSYTTTSSDDGQTWGPRQYLPGLPGYDDLIPGKRAWFGGRHRGQVIATQDGRLLIGTYDRKNNSAPFRCFLYDSADMGQSWRYVGLLTDTEDETIGFAEPTLYRLANNDLMALHRTFGAAGKLAVTRSNDEGHSWTSPEFLPVIGHPFHVLTLNPDWALVLYAFRSKSSSIKAHLMNRHSGVFESTEIVLREGAATQDIGYPGGLVLADGRVLVAYYWVDEDGTRHIEGVTLTAKA
jgi:spore coat polysaccharide biosynthesis protein SpsF